ncbi:Ribonuclease T2-like protein [Kalmanozyma brasiliensis GHG001]|uniref:ribonuclease T2 n=1 Tax=Kalmanozyma brasiliensis (strain GHG001) TaxID=1365824 RepID=V5E520_KALBG|nr:Ribonuclease T2-like protein [Kalmanozyma brasiliensis GHG001]EST05311.1 Ribonuclease T2-like protein [Kalmanozyma brasiliensis GHG001]
MKFTPLIVLATTLSGAFAQKNPLASLGPLGKLGAKASDAATCAIASSQLSCHASYDIPASSSANCCFNGAISEGDKQSGLVLSTSFWTTTAADPANNGPKDSTTIHGLWPDYCDGTYPAFCSNASGIPEYTGAQIEAVMQKYDPALFAYYQTYFKDLNGDSADFLEHEYNKHGTCFTTMRPTCQPALPWISKPDFAVLNYFRQIAHKFAERPTYNILANAGIVPSATQNYTLVQVQDALKKVHGGTPYVGCNKKTGALSEFWFYWNVRGQVNFGLYEPVESTTKSNCPASLRYLPKP